MADAAPLIDPLQRIIDASDAFVSRYNKETEHFPDDSEWGREICIYLVGSFARGEGIMPPGETGSHQSVPQSDIDLFFVAAPKAKITREKEIRLFYRFIDLHLTEGYKRFSRDCEFLKVHEFDDLWKVIGAPADDSTNTFTARMLLLLEGVNLYNPRVHEQLIKATLKQYFKDYMFNEQDFKPQFLINDITRYWKTLCLNYEAFRNHEDQFKTREDNLKLRFSRKLLCFSTVVGLLDLGPAVSAGDVKELVALKPLERIARVCGRSDQLREQFLVLQEEYANFLGWSRECKKDGGPEAALDDSEWAKAKASSVMFNQALFDIISLVAPDSGLRRVML